MPTDILFVNLPPHESYYSDQVPHLGMLYVMTSLREQERLGGDIRPVIWDDGWTAVTADGSRSAQFEHTVLVTDTGVDVLTR